MYAIFENGGKQYKACVGDLVKVEKLNRKTGETVEFPVILTADEKVIIIINYAVTSGLLLIIPGECFIK